MSTRSTAVLTRQSRRGRKVSQLTRGRLRYLRASAQKTRLVVDQIRGRRVDAARALLRNSRKAVARDVLKLLMSAVANTENRAEAGLVDTDELFVTRAFVDEGPVAKRIQPAPMGRAFPILKRSCHVTIELGTISRDRLRRQIPWDRRYIRSGSGSATPRPGTRAGSPSGASYGKLLLEDVEAA